MMPNDIGVVVTLFILNKKSSMNPFLPVHLMIHITKLHLPTTFPKPLYIHIPHVSIKTLAVENLDVCTTCDP
jgi:hypothetical protein